MLSVNKKFYIFFFILVSILCSNNFQYFDNDGDIFKICNLHYKSSIKDIFEYEGLDRNDSYRDAEKLYALYIAIYNKSDKRNHGYNLLIVELGKMLDVLNELSTIKNTVINTLDHCDDNFFINEDVYRKISENNKKYYDKRFMLNYNTSNYINTLKKLLINLELNFDKTEFYIFIIDFVENFIGIKFYNIYSYLNENNYEYLINHHKTADYCIRKSMNSISLIKIFNYAENFILLEPAINAVELNEIRKLLRLLALSITKSYENLNKCLLSIQNIFEMVKTENVKNNKKLLYDLRYKRTPKDILECKNLENHLNTLDPEERNVLHDLIDKKLIEEKEDHYNLKNLTYDFDNDVIINNEFTKQIRKNKQKYHHVVAQLKKLTSNRIDTLKTLFKESKLGENKKDFYVFICDVIEKFIYILNNNTYKRLIENNIKDLIIVYRTLEYCIFILFNKISITKIIYHTERCILQETVFKKNDLNEITKQLKALKEIFQRSYENVNKFLSPIQDICEMFNMEIKKKL
ncbi:uncharacterized protein VNE69_01220 [Vairimorpha necatrix]|uniref:Uncharacterized protein n=1 Tax=Vairimorpha necatrix TaxID=6039 RepID=A0AAX4J8T3_9MICR